MIVKKRSALVKNGGKKSRRSARGLPKMRKRMSRPSMSRGRESFVMMKTGFSSRSRRQRGGWLTTVVGSTCKTSIAGVAHRGAAAGTEGATEPRRIRRRVRNLKRTNLSVTNLSVKWKIILRFL